MTSSQEFLPGSTEFTEIGEGQKPIDPKLIADLILATQLLNERLEPLFKSEQDAYMRRMGDTLKVLFGLGDRTVRNGMLAKSLGLPVQYVEDILQDLAQIEAVVHVGFGKWRAVPSKWVATGGAEG